MRIEHADGRVESHLLRPATPEVTLGAATTGGERALSYLQLGVQHILLGVDHLLFVLGLLLIVRDRWMLVKTITSFTVAHSITLAIATLGYASAPLAPAERGDRAVDPLPRPGDRARMARQTSFTIRHPWVVAFLFGLLHGFGFASGLTAMGLPKAEVPLALLLFNLGVRAWPDCVRGAGPAARARLSNGCRCTGARVVAALPGYVVGSLGAYWTIQRIAVLLGALR